jgi:hypothetical protein
VFDTQFSPYIYDYEPKVIASLQILQLVLGMYFFSKVPKLAVSLPTLMLSCSVGTSVSVLCLGVKLLERKRKERGAER